MGLPPSDGELDQADVQLVSEDVEHVDRVAVGVVPLFAGLAVDELRQGPEPRGEGGAELREREAGPCG